MRSAFAVGLAALAALAPSPARAYVRSKVPGAETELFWCARSIPFVTNERGSVDGGQGTFDAVALSFAAWSGPACTDLTFDNRGTTPRTDVGFDQEDVESNINLVIWREQRCAAVVPAGDECLREGGCSNLYDCFDSSPATIAVTTTTFNNKTGEIYDADVEFNGAGFVFTTADAPVCANPPPRPADCVATDIRNTLTHEVGHVIGLDHNCAPPCTSEEMATTMYFQATLGDLNKRTLAQDDVDGLCAIYPKGELTAGCVKPDVAQGDCGCGAGGGAVAMAGLAAAALGALARRRRRG